MAQEKKTLSATLRTEDFGSAGSRRLLRKGFIPAVIYGKDKPEHVVINAREFNYKKSAFGETTLISLNVEGDGQHMVFVKTYQEDLLRNCIHHVDFYEVTAGHVVRAHVRIELDGTPVGTKVGGVLDQVTHEIEIECLPKDLPEVLKADVSALDINDTFRVDMLTVPEGVKILSSPDTAIATVKTVKEDVPEPATDADASATADTAAADATATPDATK